MHVLSVLVRSSQNWKRFHWWSRICFEVGKCCLPDRKKKIPIQAQHLRGGFFGINLYEPCRGCLRLRMKGPHRRLRPANRTLDGVPGIGTDSQLLPTVDLFKRLLSAQVRFALLALSRKFCRNKGVSYCLGVASRMTWICGLPLPSIFRENSHQRPPELNRQHPSWLVTVMSWH